jgi:ribonuclease VapC
VIAVDTSALMAILLGEPQAEAVMATIETAEALCLSAGTLAEALIVAERRSVGAEMRQLIEGLGVEVVAVTATGAEAVAASYRAWGKGLDPAGLNFGDCFGHALATERACPLLFVGEDFSRTDIRSATAGAGS